MANKITRRTKLTEIMRINPDAAEMLFGLGMSCIGCPMARSETLEEGCLAHGMSKKEIEKLVEKLNKTGKK
jgi:hybrid cluster-associated redox disulfide protein